jgi:hypothetical protein|tara:strand:- start:119 stop:634 length:516 start_codon:yes stop_codon:yes gene_type:complete
MAMFARQRDVSLVRTINRELLGNVITQQASFYQFKLEETKVNLYGEADAEKFYDGPFIFNCLIDRQNQSYPESGEGINFAQGISFAFLRDDLKDAEVVPEVGDIILYQQGYYGVQSTVSNQYWSGKNPDYPNNVNPLNPELEKFGSNFSIIVDTYYIPADKVAISPYKERF